MPGLGGGNLPLVISVHQNQAGEIQTSDKGFTVGTTGNASGRNTWKIMENNSIRRLLPEETEALQGFPKGYTRIPVKKVKPERIHSPKVKDEGKYEIINGEVWQMAADGPRYKSIGNSWAVPCARWIGERILKVENQNK